MSITTAQLHPIRELHEKGLYCQAYAAAAALGPLKDWRGPEARILAGRLAGNLGGGKLAYALHRLAHREHPDHPDAIYYYAITVFARRGPLALWELVQRTGELPDAAPADRADWFGLYSRVLTQFRDFAAAEQWLDRATELDPENAYRYVERAELLEREDRYLDALAAGQRALQMRPWYRPAVESTAKLLQLLERDDEALDLLRNAAERLESGAIQMQLASLETELGLHEEARRDVERASELWLLLDEKGRKWLAAHRSDCAYYCGDYPRAAELAEQAKTPFYDEVAATLRDPAANGKRTVLPVGFVRQHHMTCAPATLSAISRFWQMDADHLSVAERICYDGTPAHSERRWAEQNGWVAREFRVDWPSAVALIDRGIPFTLTTVEPASAHLQAVIGYDPLRKTLVIRDPYQRRFGEFIAKPTFERYESTGPRGMAMVPTERADLLDGISLPEQDLYDELNRLQAALDQHDRPGAAAALERMTAIDAAHRLTLWGRRSIAAYDSDTPGLLACSEKLLELYPKDANLQLGKLSCLRILAPRQERLDWLGAVCDAKGVDPLFWEAYARELQDDAREAPQVERLLRKSVRFRPGHAASYCTLAGVMWQHRRYDQALQLYRFAWCLEDKNENLACSYFVASRRFRQAEAVLAQFRDRFDRFGKTSGRPARLLFWAFEQLGREHDGFEHLARALELRPDDPDLLLLAADANARHGRMDIAAQHLEAARDHSPKAAWQRAAADLAMYRGDSAGGLAIWKQVVEAEPLAMDAHRRVTQLLAETESRASALAHLEAACQRFWHNYPLQELRLEWLRDEPPEIYEAAVTALIEAYPARAWARREHVGALLKLRRFEEAADAADVALRLEPNSPSSHSCRGMAHAELGNWEAARECYREAIRLSVDFEWAIHRLIAASDSIESRKQALAFVQGELVRQTILGDGLLAYRIEAARILDPEELLASLREALTARPDLWHAWSAVTSQLQSMGRSAEAVTHAADAAARFPLLPRLWLDLARAHRANLDREGERAALDEALAINPGWSEAARELAEVHQRAGDFEKSREVLEQSIARAPLDPYAHGCLADVFWKLGRRDEALEQARRSVQLDPGYDWGWNALRRWGKELKRPGLAAEMARELTVRRAGEARSWLVLARTLHEPADLQQRLDALAKATELNARSCPAHDLRAELLARAGRYDEALEACRPQAWGEHTPLELRGRAAWVEAYRKNYRKAADMMRQVVQETPRYYWGWSELADWYRLLEDKEQYLDAARSMARLWPADHKAQGFLADALLLNGDRAGAKAALRLAIEREPEYEFAAAKLFDIELEDENHAAAVEALAILRRYHAGINSSLRAVKLAAATGDLPAALDEITALAADDKADDWTIEQAVETAINRRWGPDIERVLDAALAKDVHQRTVPRLLVRRLLKTKRPRRVRKLLTSLAARPADEREALLEYIQLRADAQDQSIRFFIWRRRKKLRADVRLWGISGYALQTIRRYPAAVRWLGDWQQRKGVEAWMLVNLAEALRALGRDRQAHPINEYGYKMQAPPRPHGIHALWLAADAIAAGDYKAAEDFLKQVDRSKQVKAFVSMARALEAIVTRHREGPGAFDKCRRELEAAEELNPAFRKDRELRRLFRTLTRRLGGPGVGLRARLWCLTHLLL